MILSFAYQGTGQIMPSSEAIAMTKYYANLVYTGCALAVRCTIQLSIVHTYEMRASYSRFRLDLEIRGSS